MDFKKQVQHLKNPGEEGLQNMEEQCKACAMSLRDDDDDFLSCHHPLSRLLVKERARGRNRNLGRIGGLLQLLAPMW